MNKKNNKIFLQSINKLQKANHFRSWIETIVTVLALAFLALSQILWSHSIYLSLSESAVLSLTYVRLFLLMHDCTHNSLFNSKKLNNRVGIFLGFLVLVPFEYWRTQHIKHHRYNANLDQRGTGDIDLLTVDEFKQANLRRKIQYTLYRNPFVMFLLGGPFEFLIKMRFVKAKKHFSYQEKKKCWRSVNATSFFGILFYSLLTLIFGWHFLLFYLLFPLLLATAIGVFLFYVQHNFENSYFERQGDWDHFESALQGSSYIKLPKFISWLICNINYHHVHHLSPRIPFYLLNKCHSEHDVLKKVNTYSIFQAIRFIRLKLYDEKAKCMISWRDYKSLISDDLKAYRRIQDC